MGSFYCHCLEVTFDFIDSDSEQLDLTSIDTKGKLKVLRGIWKSSDLERFFGND